MAGLIIKLKPNERILINGAVLENGNQKSSILVRSQGAKILRLSEAIHPSEANTPVTRTCYALQLVVLGEAQEKEAYQQILAALKDLNAVFQDKKAREILRSTLIALEASNFYKAFREAKKLISEERRLLETYASP